MKNEYDNPALYNLPFKVNSFNGMPYRRLGNTGLKVSNVGLGTWKIGYPEAGDGSRVDEATAFGIFDLAVELGVTFWDTANRYNNASGNSERIIGKWLKSNPSQRRNIVLATKLSGTMDGNTPNHCGLSRANILEALYRSLDRLQVNCIDLLYFHSFDGETPIEESLSAIEDAVGRDLIRYFAVSNFNVSQLKAYLDCRTSFTVRSRIAAVQNQFDVLTGEAADYAGTRAMAEEQGIAYIAWSPLARGLLTGRYLDDAKIGPGDRLYDEQSLDKAANTEDMAKVRKLATLASAWDMQLNELVIAYMLRIPGMGPVIPSSSTPDQLRSNAEGGKIRLTDTQQDAIRAILAGA